jgi:hypothetical protein
MSTTVLQQFKVSALPGTLVANAVYYVSVAGNPSLVEVFVVDNAGVAAKHIINSTDVSAMIAAALGASNQLSIVADIAARDALAPSVATWAYVINATGDTSVASGGATYLFNPANTTWIKSSEAESLDVVLNWASLQNKPTSSVADIDDAVTKRHTHANKATLDLITESGGNMLYNGALPVARWETAAW